MNASSYHDKSAKYATFTRIPHICIGLLLAFIVWSYWKLNNQFWVYPASEAQQPITCADEGLSSPLSSQREKKMFCWDTHYPGLTGLTEVTVHFRPENRPLQDALYKYIILINHLAKKNIIEPKFVNPWLWILSVPQFCQRLSTLLIIANSLIYIFLFAINTINPRMCVA